MLRSINCSLMLLGLLLLSNGCSNTEKYTVEKTDYTNPPLRLSLSDDVLDPDRVPEFDPTLIHPDPVGDWELNLSQTVFRLDTPVLKPDQEPELLKLRPTYKDAIESQSNILPSVNLIDGKAKQFDDGLYAALDSAYYSGRDGVIRSHVDLIRQIAEQAGPDSPAAPFLAAGLELAGVSVPVTDENAKQEHLQEFENNPLSSKPLGFYNWTPKLAECYRFLSYFQQPLPITDGQFSENAQAMAAVIQDDAQLRTDYERALSFYAQLTNPLVALNLLDVTDQADASALAQRQLMNQQHPWVSVFPASTSKEQRLFDRLFPLGFPEGADLMQELIRAVQQGDVDLAPNSESGWYDYQTYALETFLLPNKGEESRKLLLSARYKQRMLDAFAATMTKRRETHIRQASDEVGGASAPMPLSELSPRLRLEPNATYYLRTARAYFFLQRFLNDAVGAAFLGEIKGLREGGTRETNLADELEAQKNLFYGFYLLSMEDVGLPPSLMEGELDNVETARTQAIEWLKDFAADPDLAVDTRIVVPVAINPIRGTAQLWGTAGVRLARLEVAFETQFLPLVRPSGSDEEWQTYEGFVDKTTYYIPVDEFISVEIPRLDCPTREEFRKLCDEAKSTEHLVELLRSR